MDYTKYWFIAGLVLLILELVIPGLFIIFFGIGALVTGICSIMFDLSWEIETIIFVSTSILSLILLRKPLKNMIAKSDRSAEVEDIIGEEAEVIEAITPKTAGKIYFHGTQWKAESSLEISVGTRVRIIQKRSIVLIVEPI
jgi:membrane protein implicated in regulation of membrane protease activity